MFLRVLSAFVIIWIGLESFSNLYAQEPIPAQYLITNYSAREYDSGTQNWEITQDQKGNIYVANRNGILKFNGSNWSLIPTTLETPLRSITVTENDTVFVGAVGEFGYLTSDLIRNTVFVSLSDKLADPISDVWETHATSNGVYFATRSIIYRYSEGKLTQIRAENVFQRSFLIRDNIFVGTPDKGLLKIEGDSLVELLGLEALKGQSINSMLPAPELFGSLNGVYIMTTSRHVYHYGVDTQKLTIITQIESNSELIPSQTYKTIQLKNGDIAFATLSSGVIISDSNFRVKHVIGKSNGLQLDMALNLFQDKDGSIWIALNNGISRLDLYDHVSTWNSQGEFSGGVLSMIDLSDGEVLIGASGGVYKTQHFDGKNKLSLINLSSTNYQIWQMEKHRMSSGDEVILMAGSMGLFYYKDDEIISLLNDGVFSISPSHLIENRYYVGFRDGWGIVDLIEHSSGQLQIREYQKYTTLPFEFRSIAEDVDGGLWLASRFNGVYYVSASFLISQSSELMASDITAFSEEKGLYSRSNNTVTRIDNEILFSSPNGIFTPEKKDSIILIKHPILADSTIKNLYTIQKDFDGNYWLNSGEGIIRINEPLNLEINSKDLFLEFLGENSFNNVYVQDNSTLWAGSADGLYRVNLLSMPEYSDTFHAQVNSVYLNQDSLIYGGNKIDIYNVIVDYANSDITLEYSAPRYVFGSGLRYQTRLVGYDDEWSNWSIENRRTYTNLSNGTYEFRVRAIDPFGIVSEEELLSVLVPTPWFKSIWAIFLYIGLVITFGFLVIKIKTTRIRKKNIELERNVIQRTIELQVEKRRLENLNENLRALDENRDKFLSVVAHDLRNPLMIVRSSADLIEEEIEDKAAIQEFTVYIRDAALKMQNIIEDLLEDRAKKIRLHNDLSVFDMHRIVEKICIESKVWAESKNIEIIKDLSDRCTIKADSAQISVIIDNLVSNALKYSNQNSRIWISLKKQKDKVLFSVRDEGQGMLKSEIQNIGMPSTKFSAKPTGGESSLGMGLYIVKDLLLTHQGELIVTSPGRGKGSTFTVILQNVSE